MYPILINMLKKSERTPRTASQYQKAKNFHQRRKVFRNIIQDSIFMVLGVLTAGFGLKGFLLPNSFIDGGVTGRLYDADTAHQHQPAKSRARFSVANAQ